MAAPTIPNGEEHFFPIIYEGNGGGQRVGKFVPFTDSGVISNSCIFNGATNNYLSRTPSSNGSTTTLTFSAWVKRGRLGSQSSIFFTNDFSAYGEQLEFLSNNTLQYVCTRSSAGVNDWNFKTNRTFEDTSKWYHIFIKRDTTNSTQADRVQIYVDGERITSFSTETLAGSSAPGWWNQTTYANILGNTGNGSYTRGIGYLAEVNMVDGTALDPSVFGETDTSTGRWVPKAITGVTYGTNGFRMAFGSPSAIGDDTSGNNNDFSVNDLVASDLTTDSPTQNHATIGENGFSSISEGRLKAEGSVSGQWRSGVSSLGMKSGKYYWEVKILAHTYDQFFMFGICNESTISYVTAAASRYPGVDTDSGSYGWQPNASGNDDTRFNGSVVRQETGTALANDDILQFAYDADTDRLWVGKNNTFLYSGDPANGTNYTMSGIGTRETRYAALAIHNDTSHKFEVNFGQRSFAYTPPTGFVALQQDNLSETSKGVSGLVWMKNRDTTDAPQWYDSSRGKHLYFVTNSTAAEATATDGLQKFLAGGQQIEDSDAINTSGESFVSWNWVGNGATRVTNNDGSNTTTVQANTAAGFSIVEFTPPSSGTSGITYGHGLTQAPEWFLWKRRDSTTMRFLCYHHRSYANSNGGYALEFSASNANSAFNTEYGSTSLFTAAPTATTFALRNNSATAGGVDHIAYCWHGVEGFSKFGQYNANNSTDGPFVYLGFKPKFLIIKSSAAISWYIIDATRSPINPATAGITVDNSQAEFTNQFTIDFLSNGFKIRNSNSGYGASTNSTSHDPYYYMAFAEHPFVGDGTNPVTAR